MAEENDIWDQVNTVLSNPHPLDRVAESVISFQKAIPDVQIDPLTVGQKFPQVLLGEQGVKGIVPVSSSLQSHKLHKFREIRDSLIDEIDEFSKYSDFDELVPSKLHAELPLQQLQYGQLVPLMTDECPPSIETVLYTNHDMFSGTIQSVSSAYLHSDLKQYSTTNIIGRGQLIKDKHGPQSVFLGDRLIDLKEIEQGKDGTSAKKFWGDCERIKRERNLRQIERIQDFNDRIVYLEEKYLKDQVASVMNLFSASGDMEFSNLWSELTGYQEEAEQTGRKTDDKIKKQSEELEFNEDTIISEADIQMLSLLSELQRKAQETAQINNIGNEEQELAETAKTQRDDEPVFIDEIIFGGKADLAIQEQDPKIRQQIEQALAVKTKFRIVQSSDIESQNKLQIQNKDFRWAVEDSSDMSNFYDQLPKAKMARQFNFELDDFQKRSILHLEKKESVFVCAHTSAGKTVVAEYAIALAFKHNRRALYTSPIKALSNQKYREFDTKFGNTGVVTGDVSINPGSPCLILTTEILRNMLYRGAELIRDVEWVIFDEVHYVNDQERGMVWEETIIMLPPHIGIIMLSATVPNYLDFANWVGRTRKQKVYVMKTFTRPVPLEHHLFMFDKFHTIKERDGDFLYEEYAQLKRKILEVEDEKRGLKDRIKKNLQEKKDDDLYKNTNQSMRQKLTSKQMKAKFIQNVSSESMKIKDEKRGISQLIRLCEKKDLLPCVVFVFSRRKINELSMGLAEMKSIKLIDKKTEGKILTFYHHALQKLKPQDRKSPQLLRLRELLRCGIAIHHGHLLPIAKEVVEILFSEGMVKVLFATETFAMGINMPTKTVIFHSIEKFDGQNGIRMLHSSEYTQMSGRAGRRGIDEKGNVIIYVKDYKQLPDETKIKAMVDSKGLNLESKFKITYSIIMNLLTSQDLDATEMMKRSYHENYRFVQLPKLMQSLERLKKEYVQQSLIQCPYQKGIRSGVSKSLIEEYLELCMTFKLKQLEFVPKVVTQSKTQISFPRFAIISDHQGDISLAVILQWSDVTKELFTDTLLRTDQINKCKFSALTLHSIIEDPDIQYRYRRMVLCYQTQLMGNTKQLRNKGQYYYVINEITEENLIDFLEDAPKVNTKFSLNNTQDVIYDECAQQLLEKQQNFEGTKQLLQYLFEPAVQIQNKKKNLTLQRMKYKFYKQRSVKQAEEDEQGDFNEFNFRDAQIIEMIQHQCQFCDLKKTHLDQLARKEQLRKDMKTLKQQISGNDEQFQSEFENKLFVLKKLCYVDIAGQPLIKARIAREITDQNSIYICEMMVDNIMDTLKPAEVAALMTAFVCQDRGKKNEQEILDVEQLIHEKFDEISLELTGAIMATYNLIRKVIEIEFEFDAQTCKDPTAALQSVLNFNLTQVIYLWAKGQTFVDICLQTDIEEGSIVRTIQRLENLLRGVANAFRVMGNLKMVERAEAASASIKKDIVFAESLYFDPTARAIDKQNKNNP